MFTGIIGNLIQRLTSAGMPDAQAQILGQLGNCTQPLDHRGQVTIDKSPTNAPSRPAATITTSNVGDHYSTLRVSNWNSTLNTATSPPTVSGGLTQIIDGGLYVDFIIGPGGTYVNLSNITSRTALTGASIDASGDLVFTRESLQVLSYTAMSNLTLTTVAVDVLYDTDYDVVSDSFTQDSKPLRVFKVGNATDGTVVFTTELCS